MTCKHDTNDMVPKIKCLLLLIFCLFCMVCFAAHAFAAIPLITDDTGTQGKGGFQLEIPVAYARDREKGITAEATTVGASLTYGVADPLDIVVTVPYHFLRTGDSTDRTEENGLSDIAVEAKWRWYKKNGLSLALKPGFTLPTGDDRRGLGNGRATYYILLISTITRDEDRFSPEGRTPDDVHRRPVEKTSAGEWAIHFNAGYTRNENALGALKDLWSLSVAGVLEILGDLKLAADVGIRSNTEKQTYTPPAYVLGGLIYSLLENFDIGFGVKAGLNKPETDYTIRSGITWRF